MSVVELINWVRKLYQKYQVPYGIAIWGFKSDGGAKEILVDDQGRLQIAGSVTANVDFSQLMGSDNRTLTDLYDKAYDSANDRVKTAVESTVNPPNLDVALSTRASESTLSSILSQLDITLSALRDALKGAGNKDFTTLEADTEAILAQLDITLSNLRDTLDSRLYNATDALSVYDHLKQIRNQIDAYLVNLDIALSEIKATGTETPRTLSNLYDQLASILDQLDVVLSSRASESTLSAVDSKLGDLRGALGSVATDTLRVDDAGGSLTIDNANIDTYLPNLDTALSSRASEATLSSVLAQLDIKISELRDALKQSTIDSTVYEKSLADIWYKLTQTLAIHEQTPWNPPNLDMALSSIFDVVASRFGEAYLYNATDALSVYDHAKQIRSQIDSHLPNLDTELSTRASEATLSGIKSQTDKLTFDASNFLRIALASDEIGIAKESTLSSELTRLAKLKGYDPGTGTWQDIHTDGSNRIKAQLDSIPNPTNLDVALSTRASESTLSDFSGKFPSASALGDSLSNPTTTVVGSALLGWDSAGGVWERLKTDGSGRLLLWLG